MTCGSTVTASAISLRSSAGNIRHSLGLRSPESKSGLITFPHLRICYHHQTPVSTSTSGNSRRLTAPQWLWSALVHGMVGAPVGYSKPTCAMRLSAGPRTHCAEEKRAVQDRAYDLWLDCYSQRDIAEIIGKEYPAFRGTGKSTIDEWLGRKSADAENRPPDSRQHFDIWQFATADQDAGSQSYFGALPPQVVENLLWFFTEPGDIVVDPFAGSGTTVDVAKAMGRRVWASDIRGNHYSPHLPIHKHDITTGWPDAAQRMHAALQRRQLSPARCTSPASCRQCRRLCRSCCGFFLADAIRTRRARRHKTSHKLTATCPCANSSQSGSCFPAVDMRAHPNSRQTLRGLTDSRACRCAYWCIRAETNGAVS